MNCPNHSVDGLLRPDGPARSRRPQRQTPRRVAIAQPSNRFTQITGPLLLHGDVQRLCTRCAAQIECLGRVRRLEELPRGQDGRYAVTVEQGERVEIQLGVARDGLCPRW